MGNGITNCYPDEVENFILITVLSLCDHDLEDRKGLSSNVDSREDFRGDVNRRILDQDHRELVGMEPLLVGLESLSSRGVEVHKQLKLAVE